jgi:SAM-dependent methyltransferase
MFMTGFLRRAVRMLAAPFVMGRRLACLGDTIDRRLNRFEQRSLRALADQQVQLKELANQLARTEAAYGRLAAASSASKFSRAPFNRELPPDVSPADEVAGAEGETDCPQDPVLRVAVCPVCGNEGQTPVCRFNKMITMRRMPDAEAARYDYAMCHGCGTVYARRRPTGPRFAWLLEHFEESLGRADLGTTRAGKMVLNSYSLDDEGRARLRALASKGVFVSEHGNLKRRDYLWQLKADRLANSRHLETLGSLLDLKAPRVLEIRSRLGSILVGLRRLYRGECYALAMFPSQQFLIQEVYGIPAAAQLDCDQFTIPYAPPFDLILSNHMLTHAVRPGDFLATVRGALRPGGHLYLYNEPVEDEFLFHEKSMFNTLNAFHLQTFDRASFVRALSANGFEVLYLDSQEMNLSCLARRAEEPVPWSPIPERERASRRIAYRSAEELSILLLPEHARSRLADRWQGAIAHGLEKGFVAADHRGRLRLMLRPAAMRANALD